MDDVTVEGDETRLERLFGNLFRNASEHGDADEIRVGLLDSGFYVADDGTGIPESNRAQVFRGGFSTDRDGTGFGLALVREIAEAHGYDVTVTESDNGGARFEFRPRGIDID
jgi:signal transduction histidine kinase